MQQNLDFIHGSVRTAFLDEMLTVFPFREFNIFWWPASDFFSLPFSTRTNNPMSWTKKSSDELFPFLPCPTLLIKCTNLRTENTGKAKNLELRSWGLCKNCEWSLFLCLPLHIWVLFVFISAARVSCKTTELTGKGKSREKDPVPNNVNVWVCWFSCCLLLQLIFLQN